MTQGMGDLEMDKDERHQLHLPMVWPIGLLYGAYRSQAKALSH